jgi:hypothetical protein
MAVSLLFPLSHGVTVRCVALTLNSDLGLTTVHSPVKLSTKTLTTCIISRDSAKLQRCLSTSS